jgi:ubiquinone biosynthesis protein UbiJ
VGKVLQKNQLSGKVITAKMIDRVAKDLSNSNTVTVLSPEVEQRNGLVKQIREKVKTANLDQILVEIKGDFLIENDLVSVWKSLNQDSSEITEKYKVYISLIQAEELGLIRKA